MRINILTNYDFISFCFMYPLLVNKTRLRELDVSIKYFTNINDEIYYCDILMLDSKYFRPLWKDNWGDVLSLLQRIKEKCSKVVWLDTTDSTGATHFQVLSYVDKYWKKQLFKDLTLYRNEYYGARIYTDFYKERFKLDDENAYSVEPIKDQYIDKLSVSWNLGLSPISMNRTVSHFKCLIPWRLKERFRFKYKVKSCLSRNNRLQTICFRGTNKYANKAISFQRIKTIEKLKGRKIRTESVKYNKYMGELKNTKIAVSPFGAGEICYRDFEIILTGAVLFKPSMSHLKTWPDLYIENKTYVPFKWDFSDFDEKVDNLLGNADVTIEISKQAQKRYGFCLSNNGQEVFCQRFLKKINEK